MWKHPGVCGLGGLTVAFICDSVASSLPYDCEKRFDLKHGAWLTSAVLGGAALVPGAALVIGLAAAPAWTHRAIGGVMAHIAFICVAALGNMYMEINKDTNTPFDPMYPV